MTAGRPGTSDIVAAGPHRLLIVDDNEAIHDDVRKVLQPSSRDAELDALEEQLFGSGTAQSITTDIETHSATQGEEAAALVEQHKCDGRPFSIALVDVRMPPGWDGIRTAEEIWAIDPQVCIIICSAYSDYTRDEIVGRLGLSEQLFILKKPFDPEELQQLVVAICRNRVAQEQMRRVHEQQSALWFDDNPGIVFRLTPGGVLVSASRYAERRLGNRVRRKLGRRFEELVNSKSCDDFRRLIRDTEAGSNGSSSVRLWLDLDDGPVAVMAQAQFVGIGTETPSIWLSAVEASGTEELAERLLTMERTDLVTGLPNRYSLTEALSSDGHLTNARSPTAVAVVRIDQAELVRRNTGVAALNAVRVQLGTLLTASVREGDVVASIDDTSFGMVLYDCPLALAEERGDAIRRQVRGYDFVHGEVGVPVSVSVGLAAATGGDPDLPLRQAEAACADAQRFGGNRARTSEPGDLESRRRQLATIRAAQISDAIKLDRLVLYAQPIVDLSNDLPRPPMTELLVRMLDDGGKIVPPGDFLPVAEQYQLSEPIDRWVLRRALAWLQTRSETVAAVNLSGYSLGSTEFLRFVKAQLAAAQDSVHRLHFEITESAAITHLQTAKRFIYEMTELGAQFSLDDFGTGLCSFAYLRDLPVSTVKIDGSFVREAISSPAAFATVRAINDVAKAHGKKTVAEFVDSQQTVDLLRSIGVDYGQGYFFGKPAPLEQAFTDARSQGAKR